VLFILVGAHSIPSGVALRGIRMAFVAHVCQTPTHSRTCDCVAITNRGPEPILKRPQGAFEYWLCLISNSRTNNYADFITAGEEIEQAKDLLALPNLH